MSEAITKALQMALDDLTTATSFTSKKARDRQQKMLEALRAALSQAGQGGKGEVVMGPLEQRNIFDAIRGAYDLGYNDATNARAVPGDSAPGYDGRNVEADHGGALFNMLNRRLSAAQPAPAVPAGWQSIAQRLRSTALDIRRKPYPISDIIPLLNEAADALSAAPKPGGTQ